MRVSYRFPVLLLLALVLLLTVLITPAQALTPSVHLTLGNPSSAVPDPALTDNYLIERAQYALAYRRDDGIPRWVSWHLTASDIGPVPRCNCFSADTSLPAGWNRVVTGDYTNSGYDRGHMTASEDRTATDADNAATFVLTNVLPQSPQNNRGPWAQLESESRDLAQAGNELYIVSGPVGTLGRLTAGTLRIPAATWKAELVLPEGSDDVLRVTTATRVIAIRIPNDKDDLSVQQSDDWPLYRTSADAIETETGDDLFNAVPPAVQRVIEERIDTGPQDLALSVVTGTPQTTPPGAAFLQPLTVVVRTGSTSTPQANIAVVFASLGSGPDARFANGDTQITVLTDVNGQASVPVSANSVVGSYRVEASIAGVYTPAVFTLSNVDGFTVALPLVVGP